MGMVTVATRAGMTSEVSMAAIMEGSMEVAGIIELGCLACTLCVLNFFRMNTCEPSPNC